MFAVWKQQADVYHVTGDIHYVCCVLPKKKTLLTVHDCEVLHRLSGWKREIVRFFWYTHAAKHATRITVNSEETKRQLLKVIRYPAERIHVIPVSVSPLYQPDKRPFNSDNPHILQVGTKLNKNVPRLVQALQGLRCHLDIVGPVDEALRQLLKVAQISWTGWGRLNDDQMYERYREADIVAFVSTHEGFGMPIVEAQCVERVCVTSNLSSMPEVAGNGACLVDPYDINSIRRGILRLTNDSTYRNSCLNHGRLNRERFNSQLIARQFGEVYRLISNGQ
jgi:glycosyltransferase involved in cell wall biosynthesis